MDNTFQLLDEAGRVDFFRLIMQSIGYSYVCLWSYFRHPYNCFYFLDGFFYEENNQPSSSSGSKARRLFDEYRQSTFIVENGRVPGIAFNNSLPYVEIQELELQKLASTEAQRQFYQEARIKTAVFMGCRSGEIEIGFAHVSQVDIEKEMRSLFPGDFSPQISEPFWRLNHQNPLSSSSSLSLTSPSMDSPECSSLLFNIPSNAQYFPETPRSEVPSFLQLPTTPSPCQEAMQAFARARNIPFPTPETENAAVARAFLAVLSSNPSSSTLSHQPQQNDILPYNHRVISKSSAFESYESALRPTTQMRTNLDRQSMLKKSIAFVRSLNSLRYQDRCSQATIPTSTQLRHMISERKRREKLGESFQALRSLLPSGAKKDKASLLATTREYLSSLNAQIAELTRRNQLLTAQLLPAKEAINVEETSSSNERLGIRIISHLDSTIEEGIVELRVTVRGECPMEDMLIRILEFLKQVENVSLVSMESSTGQMIELISSTSISLTLRIHEVNELWDEAGFRQAVRRVVADLAP